MPITVMIRYSGKNGNALKFAEEMTAGGVVAAIRAEAGNLRYAYHRPMDDPESVLLIDSWTDQAALDAHHASPMMDVITRLRETYDLHMTVERFVGADAPEADGRFLRTSGKSGRQPGDARGKDFMSAPILTELVRCCTNMYAHGWDERNGGNISVLLDENELANYLEPGAVQRRISTGFRAPALDGKSFLVTGTGKYFKNVQYDPAANLGVVRLTDGGETAEVLWGFSDGGSFTSELPAHMMSHAVRLAVDPAHRVVMHCHPNHLLAMTYVHDLDERAFTRSLWQMESECVFVFPEGVNVLPWMLCGTNEIGEATAEKMKTARLVLWAQHGIYAAGRDLDECFGLIETAEKAAEVWLKIAQLPRKQTIPDDGLRQLAARYGVSPREGYLD